MRPHTLPFGLSAASHLIFVILLLLLIKAAPAPTEHAVSARLVAPLSSFNLGSDASGGGGGGGHHQPQPARQTPVRPVAYVPAVPVANSLDSVPGEFTTLQPTPTISQGPGSDGGAGTGTRGGSGAGDGQGVGPGEGQGSGGNARAGDAGVIDPQVIREVRPKYTVEALRMKTQGLVELEIVVLADGSVGEVRVISAPGPRIAGLDAAAVDAVKQWRFKPGLVKGKPAPVIVRVEMTFTLR